MQDVLPLSIPLGKVSGPGRPVPSAFTGRNVSSARDLPGYLLGVPLVASSLRVTEEEATLLDQMKGIASRRSWSARWESRERDSSVEASWDTRDGWKCDAAWRGTAILSLSGDAGLSFADLLKQGCGRLAAGVEGVLAGLPATLMGRTPGFPLRVDPAAGCFIGLFIPLRASNVRRAAELFHEIGSLDTGADLSFDLFLCCCQHEKKAGAFSGAEREAAWAAIRASGLPPVQEPGLAGDTVRYVRNAYVLSISSPHCLVPWLLDYFRPVTETCPDMAPNISFEMDGISYCGFNLESCGASLLWDTGEEWMKQVREAPSAGFSESLRIIDRVAAGFASGQAGLEEPSGGEDGDGPGFDGEAAGESPAGGEFPGGHDGDGWQALRESPARPADDARPEDAGAHGGAAGAVHVPQAGEAVAEDGGVDAPCEWGSLIADEPLAGPLPACIELGRIGGFPGAAATDFRGGDITGPGMLPESLFGAALDPGSFLTQDDGVEWDELTGTDVPAWHALWSSGSGSWSDVSWNAVLGWRMVCGTAGENEIELTAPAGRSFAEFLRDNSEGFAGFARKELEAAVGRVVETRRGIPELTSPACACPVDLVVPLRAGGVREAACLFNGLAGLELAGDVSGRIFLLPCWVDIPGCASAGEAGRIAERFRRESGVPLSIGPGPCDDGYEFERHFYVLRLTAPFYLIREVLGHFSDIAFESGPLSPFAVSATMSRVSAIVSVPCAGEGGLQASWDLVSGWNGRFGGDGEMTDTESGLDAVERLLGLVPAVEPGCEADDEDAGGEPAGHGNPPVPEAEGGDGPDGTGGGEPRALGSAGGPDGGGTGKD